MPLLLHLDSSADPRTSRSRALTRTVADSWRSLSPEHTVRYRDLHARQLPHLPDASLHWPRPENAAPAPHLQEAELRQRTLIDELLSADALLVGAPMYNYTVPSTLKVWLDHIHVPGVTAGEPGSQPLAGRPVVIVTSRGASYPAGSDRATMDHVTPVLELILGMSLGMRTSVISVDLTLAETVPALFSQRDAAAEQWAAAHHRAETLGRLIGEQVQASPAHD